jgi:hypothetical protein
MVLVACVVGLYCAGELRDIKLCQLTFEQRNGPASAGWVRAVLFVLIALRQYVSNICFGWCAVRYRPR